MNLEQIEKGGYDHFMLKRYMSNLASLKTLIEDAYMQIKVLFKCLELRII
jgi:glucosamine 6-phosphate synthetase-like amidotransferase/phosphosugar isomerase protein